VKEQDYELRPGRYVGLPDEYDEFVFAKLLTSLNAEFEEQLKEETELNKARVQNPAKVKLDNRRI